MKVAILYICTGKYNIFWDNFYTSMKQNFLINHHVEYFVFTDGEINLKDKNIHILFQKRLGWPLDTLMRFHMFYEVKDRLALYDYIFFLNANMIINEKIGVEILPVKKDFLCIIHPGFYNKPRGLFTYETREESTAYIAPHEGVHYFMGGFNGGESKHFLQLVEDLAYNVEKDWEKDIVAIWHDESHLNRYFIDHVDRIKILPPSYGYPEGWSLPLDKKITILDKSKLRGHDFLRN